MIYTLAQVRDGDGWDPATRLAQIPAGADDETFAMAMRVLARPDARDALDYVLSGDGPPSCGCGGDHWSCATRPCRRCGDPVATLSTDDLCDGCVAELAQAARKDQP